MFSWLGRMRLRLATLFFQRTAARQLDGEIQFHIDQQIAENLAAGMPPDEARSAALRLFGSPASVGEEARETWGWGRIAQFAHTLRYAARSVRRAQGFAVIAIAVMALGIGATTALFTVVRAVLLKPLPFADSGRLVRLYESSAHGTAPYNFVAGGIFAQWQKENHGFSGLAMVGTPQTIADEMEEWLETEGSDGFTVMFPYLPGGLEDFCDRVIPELQRRGLFRMEYEGATLRENLGLPRPRNRFFQN